MKKYRLRVGLDVDDILYDCNAYALKLLNEEEGIEPPLTIHDIKGWGTDGSAADRRIKYFSSPEFVASQPLLEGAVEFVDSLLKIAEVFIITAVPPECMSERAMRLRADFPNIPEENIIIGTRKDMVGVDILLDDGAHNITRTKAEYPVLFRKPWNTMLSGLLSVNSYDDFLQLVNMLLENDTKEPSLSSGGVLCLVGPTGSGKNEIASRLVKDYGFEKPLSATTRPRRSSDDYGYHFLTEDEFIKKAENGEFLETTVYSGWHFGTEAAEIDSIVKNGKIAAIPIDICGALTLKGKYKDKCVLAFIKKRRYDAVCAIVTKGLSPEDAASRILSLDDEYRNEELCDITVKAAAADDACAMLVSRLNKQP